MEPFTKANDRSLLAWSTESMQTGQVNFWPSISNEERFEPSPSTDTEAPCLLDKNKMVFRIQATFILCDRLQQYKNVLLTKSIIQEQFFITEQNEPPLHWFEI